MATSKPTFQNLNSFIVAVPRFNRENIDVPYGKYVTGDYFNDPVLSNGIDTGYKVYEFLKLTDVSSGSDPDSLDIIYDYEIPAGTGVGDPLTVKGDIYTRSASGNTRLPVGLNTQVLVADSTTTTGLKWSAVASLGGTVTSVDNGTVSSLLNASWATKTTTPALSLDFRTVAQNKFLLGPSSGADAIPTFRVLASADLGSYTLNPAFNSVVAMPSTDVPSIVSRRSGALANANIHEFQAQDNSLLSAIDKDGKFTGQSATTAGLTGLTTNTIPVATSSTALGNSNLINGTNLVEQRNSTNAQKSSLYKTYTSATNFERLIIDAATDPLAYHIGSEYGSAGGSPRQLVFGGGSVISDVAPETRQVLGKSAYSQATTNTTGGNLLLAGGIGRRLYTIVLNTGLSGKTFTLTANGTAVVLTAGTSFAVGSDDTAPQLAVAATNLAAAINADSTLGPLMTATSVAAKVYIDKKTTLSSLTISTNAGGTIATATSGASGITALADSNLYFGPTGAAGAITINPSTNVIGFYMAAFERFRVEGSSISVRGTGGLALNSVSGNIGSGDVYLHPVAPATLQLGFANSASPVNQTLQSQGSTAMGTAGSTLTIQSGSGPTSAAGATTAGSSLYLKARNAIASTDTAGAAAGGSVTITAGAAARYTSGNANGGDINLIPGAGVGTGTPGQVIVPVGTSNIPGLSFSGVPTAGFNWRGSQMGVMVGVGESYSFTANRFYMAPAMSEISFNDDARIRRSAAATLQLGAADSATPVAQTLTFQGSRGTTDTNVAGVDATVRGSLGTGTAASGKLIFSVGTPQATDTTQHVASTVLTLSNTGTSGTANGIATVNGLLVLPKAISKGIQVDTTSPTYPWKDLVGVLRPDPGGSNAATLSTFRGGLCREFAYGVSDKMDMDFHMPHDYVPGSDLYVHVHWSHNGTAISGNLTIGITSTYAKGHNQAIFPAEKTVPISYNTVNLATTPQYIHRIEEVQLTSNGGSATLMDSAQLEPDGIIMMNMTVTGIPTITGGTPNEPFIFFADIHYQSTGIGTKQKSPNPTFYS